jgi:hypothetical protein
MAAETDQSHAPSAQQEPLNLGELTNHELMALGYTRLREKAFYSKDSAYGFRSSPESDPEGSPEKRANDTRAFLQEFLKVGRDLFRVGDFVLCAKILRRLAALLDDQSVCMTLANALLSMGHFDEATQPLLKWDELRLGYLKKPCWQGQDLSGKRLLIATAGGLGDVIQSLPYIEKAACLADQVYFAISPELWRCIGTRKRVALVADDRCEFDFVCSLATLIPLLGMDAGMRPFKTPYLHAEPQSVARWRQRLPEDGFLIGIAWEAQTDSPKSIPLAAFAPLAKVPGVRLISLQINMGLEQLEALPDGMNVQLLGDDFNGGRDRVVDDLAVMQSLDLVITCDTSVGHIAGAAGVPVWVLLRSVSDWRWMQDWRSTEVRPESPWYPTMRLFRQRQAGDWLELTHRVARELADLVRNSVF